MENKALAIIVAMAMGAFSSGAAQASAKPQSDVKYAKCVKVRGLDKLDTLLKVKTDSCGQRDAADGGEAGGTTVMFDAWIEIHQQKVKGAEPTYFLAVELDYSRQSMAAGDVEITNDLQAGWEQFDRVNVLIGDRVEQMSAEILPSSSRSCGKVPNPLLAMYSCSHVEVVAVELPAKTVEELLRRQAANPLELLEMKFRSRTGNEAKITFPLKELAAAVSAYSTTIASLSL